MTTQGMVIQTPELFFQKGAQAEFNIGSHILVGALFAGHGAVFGMKFDSRRNKEFQWIKAITPRVILAGWGLYSDFQKVAQFLNDSAQGMTELVGESYATVSFLSKSASLFLGNKFEVAAVSYATDILLVDVESGEVVFVNFRGHSTLLRGFGVLGGYQYAPSENSFVFPRKNAIKYLENTFREKELLPKKEAIHAVTKTLFDFDPKSKKDTFMLVVYQNLKLECFLVERKTEVKNK